MAEVDRATADGWLASLFSTLKKRWTHFTTDLSSMDLERDPGCRRAYHAEAIARFARDVMLTSPGLPAGCTGVMVHVLPGGWYGEALVHYDTTAQDSGLVGCRRDLYLFGMLARDRDLRRAMPECEGTPRNPVRVPAQHASATMRLIATLSAEAERRAAQERLDAWLRHVGITSEMLEMVCGDESAPEKATGPGSATRAITP